MSFTLEHAAPESWPAIYALLAPAIAHGGDSSATELIDDLLGNRALLWVKRDPAGAPIAAAVTTVHPDATLHCQLLGGRGMHDWIDELIATIAERAKLRGVSRFTMEGRPGWGRMLAKRGWTRRRVVMQLDL